MNDLKRAKDARAQADRLTEGTHAPAAEPAAFANAAGCSAGQENERRQAVPQRRTVVVVDDDSEGGEQPATKRARVEVINPELPTREDGENIRESESNRGYRADDENQNSKEITKNGTEQEVECPAEDEVQLDHEQKKAVVLATSGKSFFFTGKAGTGKSTTLRAIVRALSSPQTKRNVALTASTGAAAKIIGGDTLHSWSGCGLGKETGYELAEKVSKNTQKRRSWVETDTLIVDEVSMLEPSFFEKLDYIGRKVRNKEHVPFGGIQLILTGDFAQLPPVSRKDPRGPPISDSSRFVFQTKTWKGVIKETVLLTKVYRQKDTDLVRILDCLREGRITSRVIDTLRLTAHKSLENNKGIVPTMLFAYNVSMVFFFLQG